MIYSKALQIAEQVKAEIAPYCDRLEIAGSIRRKKSDCGDIEIVAIEKDYEIGLFAKGLGLWLDQQIILKGKPGPECRYLQIQLKEIKLDLFFATPENWGYIMAIRTGPAEFSHLTLAVGWKRAGFHGEGGMLLNSNNEPVEVREEEDLFKLIGFGYIKPEFRI